MKETTLLSFQLSLSLPFNRYKTKEEECVEQNVILLETLSFNRFKQFSAAAFFGVDFSPIFSMVGCVSAFVLLAIPFSKTP